MSNKVGKNKPCPCGSGKKYKYCHMNPPKRKLPQTFLELLEEYNAMPILGTLGALQLYPQNHGRNFRFEQLCRQTLLKVDAGDSKPIPQLELLKKLIEGYIDGSSMEDPLSNAFTERVIFEMGNYLVYSGIYADFTMVLNILLESIFLVDNTLPQEFKKEVRDAAGFLLLMSDRVAGEAGHHAYLYEASEDENIKFPEESLLLKFTNALMFSGEFIDRVVEKYHYDKSILQEFTVHLGSQELEEEDPDENIVNFKPLIEWNGGLMLYMPTGIVNALVTFIQAKAKHYAIYKTLMDQFLERQFHLSCRYLGSTGWIATNITLPPIKPSIKLRETVFQFDNQKFGYVCFVQPSPIDEIDLRYESEKTKSDPYEERTKEVVDYLNQLDDRQNFQILALYILGEGGYDSFFSWAKPAQGIQSVAFRYSELWTITHSSKVNNLSLWKFAKCYQRTNEQTRVMAGTLDAFALYMSNRGSLLDSERANPLGGLLVIPPGESASFTREIQKQQDEHAVPIFFNQRRAFAKVDRFKDYAPIYREKEVRDCFRIVIESYKMPIWIISPQSKGSENNWATYACEAVAFWLYKMASVLGPLLNDLRLIQFQLEIIVDNAMLNTNDFQAYPELDGVPIRTEIVAPSIRINIPFDFNAIVSLPDNTADKILMKNVLEGIAKYITASGNKTGLNTQKAEEIIDDILKPSTAKMLLFSDATANVKLDNRNLPPLHYLNETDISFVLDNLVSYLPKGTIIPPEITDKQNKIKLCDTIVNALISQLTDQLLSFDGPALLEWLIAKNEKCIQVRETREIQIPAKIACFSDIKTEVTKLSDEENNLVVTAHATRILIEFLAVKIPSGNRWPNFDDIDQLLALTNQLTEWGTLSEMIRFGMNNPGMGLLPSGRIGTEKTLEREVFTPYALSKVESLVFKQVEDFVSNYNQPQKAGKAVESEKIRTLDEAFLEEFGIPLSKLIKIIGTLVNKGLQTADACMKMEESTVKSLLCSIDGMNESDVDIALTLLTLIERNSIGEPPAGYTLQDIFPWRYSRSLSYLRRPLVKIRKESTIYYYYGYRHIVQFMDNLMFLLYTGKLSGIKSGKLKGWLAGISGEKGKPFRAAVKKWFTENSNYEIIPYEVNINKDVPKNHIAADKSYGDIDLFVIDHDKMIIYSIECKNIQGGKNVHEMKLEMDEYLGRGEPGSAKAKIYKHVERDQWLQANKLSMAGLLKNPESYIVKSFILTAEEIPLVYLKKGQLPLPIKSFAFLRMNGLNYLFDL